MLSNNDGCIIARSAEAKKLGIPMGAAYFKVQGFLKAKNVTVFSSNFALYGDLSARVMSTMETICPEILPYSIDEAFIPMYGALAVNAEEIAATLRETIRQWTGIPVSVGIAPTKTLAKVANHIAKKESGVCVLRHNAPFSEILSKTPVEDIWGIGRRQSLKLAAVGIRNAWQLTQADDNWLRKHLTVTGWNTALELRGIPSVSEGDAPTPRKSVLTSRSFGEKVKDKAILAEAIASFTARAAERMRRDKMLARGIGIFIRTSYFDQYRQYEEFVQQDFQQGTADTNVLQRIALGMLDGIFKPGFAYAKAGVLLYDLIPQGQQQASSKFQEHPRSAELMAALDRINGKYGHDRIRYGAEGLSGRVWKMRQNNLSPRATTDWNELATAFCK